MKCGDGAGVTAARAKVSIGVQSAMLRRGSGGYSAPRLHGSAEIRGVGAGVDVDDGRILQVGRQSTEQLFHAECKATRGKAARSKHRIAAGCVGDRISRSSDVLVDRLDL